MVRQVKELGSELEIRLLRGLEVLEEGEIEPVETRADKLIGRATQGSEVLLTDRRGGGGGGERRRIQKMIDIGPPVRVLSGKEQRVTGPPRAVVVKSLPPSGGRFVGPGGERLAGLG